MKVLVVTGGDSSERKISLVSAKAVKEALEKNGFKVKLFDLKKGYSELEKQAQDQQVIFPILHGKPGEDGTLYEFLQGIKKPFVGSNHQGAKIAFDKVLFKKYLDKNKFPTPEWKIIKKVDPRIEFEDDIKKIQNEIMKFGFPCVLKAASGGSSREVVLLYSKEDLKNPLVKKILKLDDTLYVEKLAKGIEVTAGVLHDQALPLIEIVPPQNSWFDYKNKYSGETREIPHAPSVDKKTQEIIQKMALTFHLDLNLRSFSRTDVIIADNSPYVLEINTPNGVGMTSESLFPKAAQAAGLEFPDLTKKLVELALKNH